MGKTITISSNSIKNDHLIHSIPDMLIQGIFCVPYVNYPYLAGWKTRVDIERLFYIYTYMFIYTLKCVSTQERTFYLSPPYSLAPHHLLPESKLVKITSMGFFISWPVVGLAQKAQPWRVKRQESEGGSYGPPVPMCSPSKVLTLTLHGHRLPGSLNDFLLSILLKPCLTSH